MIKPTTKPGEALVALSKAAIRCCKAAAEQEKLLNQLNKQLKAKGKPLKQKR